MGLGASLKHAWNVFSGQEGNRLRNYPSGSYGSVRPDRQKGPSANNERTIIGSIYTRLGIDVSLVDMLHVRTDDEGRYLETYDSGLNNCLTVEANIDQAATAFRQDITQTLLENGVAAIVPVDTDLNPNVTGGYDILTLRVGQIVQWHPKDVRVSLYNEKTGLREEITLAKSMVAIIENPLYSVMNEPNSTLQRLRIKLGLLDVIDSNLASKKLDIIIQLPYTIKSEKRREQAEQRRTDLEFQLKQSQYGVAYSDATEKVIQLNRPVENSLLPQIEFLTEMLYGQLGITKEVMNGTADEATMLNYWNRSIEPILTAIVEGMRRSFLTKTARTQKQTVMYFRNPFRLVPVEKIAEIADKFTRNEIATSNEMRQVVGWKPHSDPKADQLINANMPVNKAVVDGVESEVATEPPVSGGSTTDIMGGAFDEIESELDGILAEFSTNGNGSNASS